jgi:hypothetical protein
MPKPEFIARRAKIIDEPGEADDLAAAGDFYCVINTKTGAIVGLAKTLEQAQHLMNKRDQAFGACVHKIVPPIKPAPAG